jgi:hypothetical protein
VRESADQLGYQLDSGRRAAGNWHTSVRGEYFAAGVRGPLTGRRADLVIIDDPIKSQGEADSSVLRERLWNWYRFDLTTRLKPEGRIVLIMTRWHEDDLAGRLLAQNSAEWCLIRLPALAEEDDPLQRTPGAALWPDWEDEGALLRRRDTVGERAWVALFQQSPRPLVGSLFKIDCIDIIDSSPGSTDGMMVRAWDLAMSSATDGNDPDWTSGVKLMRDAAGRFVVVDVVHMRGSPREVETTIAETARIDGPSVSIGLPQDPGQRGAVGSVAIQMRVLRGRIFFSVLDTTYLTPEWDPEEPDRLVRVTERYKVPGSALTSSGYEIADPGPEYWFMRTWDADGESWFAPQPVGAAFETDLDETRSVQHGLGFVPIVWIRNLPGPSSTGDVADGACTFRAAIETQIEIDYQLSQAGRGLKYSSDPTLLIKEPATTDSQIIKGAGNALVVSEKGDARLLEIGGTASAAVIEYVRTLRELALESVHGNRANADRLTAAQSGRALELMNQGLVWLADNLRVSYGEGALLSLARMVLSASQVFQLRVMGQEIGALDPAARLSLNWPRWYPTTADDRQKDAQTLSTLANAGQISRESAVKSIANTFDIEDVPGELARIAADRTINGNT